jgi:hypothetical protein
MVQVYRGEQGATRGYRTVPGLFNAGEQFGGSFAQLAGIIHDYALDRPGKTRVISF